MPAYLPRVPRTGLVDYPDFIYTRFTNTHYSLIWWDLGTRNGKPTSGLRCYVEGDPAHAILAITLDQQRQVVEARVDRMPADHERIEFDPELWKRNEKRIEMVRSLPEDLAGQGTNEVFAMLGPPNGSRLLRDAPWELKIECPIFMGWDVYWPTGNYPGYAYGGDTEKDWRLGVCS